MSSNNESEDATEKVAATAATAADADTDLDDAVKTKHLGWTKKQGRILSGGGIVESLPWKFEETELPHYHLLRNETHSFFQQLNNNSKATPCKRIENPVIGVWERPLFYGGYEQSTSSEDEITYNIQTQNLFIDLRIPRTRSTVFRQAIIDRKVSNLSDLTPNELRLYARQHVFGGYTECHLDSSKDNQKQQFSGTRRHAIDWNFVGIGRPRPNKWWIKFDQKPNKEGNVETWEELGYVRDEDWSIPYYFERWERRPGGGPIPRLALRKASPSSSSPSKKRKAEDSNDAASAGDDDSSLAYNFTDDGIIVIVGDHFNYLLPRKLTPGIAKKKEKKYPNVSSLVDLVDVAVSQGDLDIARAYLSIEAGHGRVSNGWTVDCSIPFWKEGTQFWDPRISGQVKVVVKFENENEDTSGCAPSVKVQDLCKVMWKDQIWDIYDCSFETVDKLQSYFS
mmetsp:Transcript_15809/g.39288  ORF Transcript_15809/g.39288 Transcript_15809/m.39288 type:complete len:452 (+) Transcript_15809:103-1458(+)